MEYRAGTVAVVGKPNVGKSTLVNALVGAKVSIVSNKPQTTRRRSLGIVHGEDFEAALVDTPGVHEPHTALAKTMVQEARAALAGVQVILIVVDGSKPPNTEDEELSRMLRAAEDVPRLLCLNKMDLLKPEFVVRNVEAYQKVFATERYVLTTATKGHNLDLLLESLRDLLPPGEARFGEDEYTDQPSRVLSAELVREKILNATRLEVPHATAVHVVEWVEEGERVVIHAVILVEKPGQRAILIGKGGQFLKTVGTAARKEIEELIGQNVYLQLHVKVESDWRMNPRILQELEFGQ
jgi:GTP-binding protein Era